MDPSTVHQTCPPYTTTSEFEPNTCVAVCPAPLMSDQQQHVLTIIVGVEGHVAICCTLLVFFAYMTHPWKASYPRSSVAWLQVPLFLASVAIVIGVWVGWEKVGCDKCSDPNNGYTWIGCWFSHWSWCWVSAWLLFFASLSAAVWYCLVGVGLLISISTVRVPLSDRAQAVIFHILGTVIPFLYAASFGLADQFISNGYGPCFVSSSKVLPLSFSFSRCLLPPYTNNHEFDSIIVGWLVRRRGVLVSVHDHRLDCCHSHVVCGAENLVALRIQWNLQALALGGVLVLWNLGLLVCEHQPLGI